MQSIRNFLSTLSLGVLVLAAAGCQKNDTVADESPAQKGPAEKVGQNIDKAAGEAAKHLSTMADHAGKGIEKAAESLQKEPKASDGNDTQPQETQK
jgi:hypothetical protein